MLNILISYVTIISQFGNLGFTSTIIKFFPYFKNKDKFHNGFLKLITIVSFLGFLISVGIFFIIKSFLIKTGTEKSILFFEYIYLIIPLVFFTIYFNAYDAYYRAHLNSVPGIFYKEFGVRILVLVFILLFYFKIIDFRGFVLLYVLANSMPAIGIMFSLVKFNEFRFGNKEIRIKKALKRAMISVSLYSIISSFSGVILISVDRIMLERFNGLSDVGIYSIAFFFSSLVAITARPISLISGAVIADFWKKKNLGKISELYETTAINQFAIGVLVLIGIWANIHTVFQILPHEYLVAKYVILLLGLSHLIDMLSGSSVNILALSKYYRYHTYFMIFFIVIAIISNWILIPIYGIMGAAIGSLISKLFYSIIRCIFLYIKFNLFPYSFKFIVVVIVGFVTYFMSRLLFIMDNMYIDFLLRSSIITIIYLLLIYIFKVSKEINYKVDDIIRFIKPNFK